MSKVKIGYLGGCWDLFHVGHLNYIREAKKHCDYLIVDVTPDEIMFKQKTAITALVAEMLQHVVGGLASLPPRAEQLFALARAPARSKRATVTSIYTTVYV